MTALLLEIKNPTDLETLVPLLRRLRIKFSKLDNPAPRRRRKPAPKPPALNELQKLLLTAPYLSDETLELINEKRNALNQWKPFASTPIS